MASHGAAAAANRQLYGEAYADAAAAVNAYPFATVAELHAELERLRAAEEGGCPHAEKLEAEARQLRQRAAEKDGDMGRLMDEDDFDGAEAAKAEADALRAKAAELDGRATRMRAAAGADMAEARQQRAKLERPLELKRTVEAELGRLERAKEAAKAERDIKAAKAAVVKANAFTALLARLVELPIFAARAEQSMREQLAAKDAEIARLSALVAELRAQLEVVD